MRLAAVKLRIESEELTRFEIELDGMTAVLWVQGYRWHMTYVAGERQGSVDIAPARTAWESALRRALADCEMHLGAVG